MEDAPSGSVTRRPTLYAPGLGKVRDTEPPVASLNTPSPFRSHSRPPAWIVESGSLAVEKKLTVWFTSGLCGVYTNEETGGRLLTNTSAVATFRSPFLSVACRPTG